MKKITLSLVFFTSLGISAQVGINNSDPKATLDVTKSATTTIPDGFITPRLTINELIAKDALYGVPQNSTVVYVLNATLTNGTTITTKTSNVTSTGFYYYNSTLAKWVALSLPKFFYMPSIYFDTTTLGTFTKDLYQLYADQFTTPAAKNPSAAASIPILGRTDLQYYITSFDSNVFGPVTINDNGIVTYTIKTTPSDGTFLNIIFVVK